MNLLQRVNHAIGLYQAADYAACRTACHAILAVAPGQPETRHLLGAADLALGHIPQAQSQVEMALRLHPQFAPALATLGRIRMRRNQPAAAAAALRRALRLEPDAPDTLAALGEALQRSGERSAETHCRHALRLDPAAGAAWRNLGHLCRAAGDPAAAAAAYHRAVRLDPDRGELLCDEFFARRQSCDWRHADPLAAALQRIADDTDVAPVAAGGAASAIVTPLASLLLDLDPAAQDRLARTFFDRVIAVAHPAAALPPAPVTETPRRLVLGYLSADFHAHATAHLIAEIFELHDRGRFRLVGLSDGPDDGSPMRRRLVQAFDRFHDVRPLDTDGIARLVTTEGVDILIDLKGITQGARLDLLARRMAPLQVTWLGYPGTTGSDRTDYVIGDRIVTPPIDQPWFRERLAILPDCYQPNDRKRPRGDAPLARSDCGLPAQGFVFAALHAPHKVTSTLFSLWLRLLAGVPGSVLWLFDPAGAAADNLRRAAAGGGIDPQRLVFAGQRPLAEHLARYRLADLCLDAFPYTGHTTTSDALWVGTPLVTCAGGTFASRVAASLLQAVALPDLVTGSLAEYEALALALAHDPARLAAYRRRLADARDHAPLFDSPTFTAYLERAFRIMWERHAAGASPETFTVPRLPRPPARR